MTVVRAALAGNPNVGKSTVFNALTGLRQHTGNWAGKTVECARGVFEMRAPVEGENIRVELTDLPGIYSLHCRSAEEEAARDHLVNARPDVTVCVCDACSLERGLILCLQIRDLGSPVVLAVNLMDEAEKKGIHVDCGRLADRLGIPVIPAAARRGEGLDALRAAIRETGERTALRSVAKPSDRPPKPVLRAPDAYAAIAADLAGDCVLAPPSPDARDRRIDRIVCGRFTSVPVMLALLLLVFWLTLAGTNAVSGGLERALDSLLGVLRSGCARLFPAWLTSMLCDGVAATVFRVVSVMLPPMAVFFPLFTLLEDFGYLPRAAFCLDRVFARCGSCGKQGLTMLMSLGCTAAGVTGCRIIDSPRERMIAILTSSLMPCNGRLPLILFALGCLGMSGFGTVLGVAAVFLLAVGMTWAASALLSKTVLRGAPSSFTLELPPYRVPLLGQTLVRSLLDRTIFVLGRAVTAAAPCGLFLWLADRVVVGDGSLTAFLQGVFEPVGRFAGMDGRLIAAFLFALPAAELMLPLALAGADGTASAASVFALRGWGAETLVCMTLFMMFHFPCATTLMTVRKETGSRGWTLFSALFPTAIGYSLCVLAHHIVLLFGVIR